MRGTRLTVLVENATGDPKLTAEHGLALWIETGSHRVLFDTGPSGIIGRNADLLGIDLASADAIVVSHGHYDHTGGLDIALRDAPGTRVFAHPDALSPKYSLHRDESVHDIGLPSRCREMMRKNAALVLTEAPTEVCGCLRVTGPVPRANDFENPGGAFYRDPDCRCRDELPDDQAAYLDTAEGAVVFLGCAHAGIVNTLSFIRDLLPGRPIRAVIGGTHLATAGEDRVRSTIGELRRMGVQHLFPVHCTGPAAAARLAEALPGRVSSCPTGTVLDF